MTYGSLDKRPRNGASAAGRNGGETTREVGRHSGSEASGGQMKQRDKQPTARHQPREDTVARHGKLIWQKGKMQDGER
jgi:hypothetical protein